MAIDCDCRRRLAYSSVFVFYDPRCPSAKIIKQCAKSGLPHLKRKILIFLRQPALLIVPLHLVEMHIPVRE